MQAAKGIEQHGTIFVSDSLIMGRTESAAYNDTKTFDVTEGAS